LSNYVNDLCRKAVKSSRSDKEFEKKLENYSDGSIVNIMVGISHFKVMIDMKGSSVESLIQDFANIEDHQTKKEVAFSILADYINHITHDRPCGRCYFEDMKTLHNKCPSCKGTKLNKALYATSIPIYMGYIKKYLRFYGILDGITDEDIKEEISMPVIMEEDYEPVTRDMFRDILEGLKNYRRRLFWHLLGTSGMRISEGCALRKDDFEFVNNKNERTTLEKMYRIRINIKPNTSKKRKQRKTFVSKEIESEIVKFLTSASTDKPLFVKSANIKTAKRNEGDLFRIACKKLIKSYPVLAEKKLSGLSKISIHSLRSYFITCVNRVDYGFGHALAGHKQYMGQYDRLTPEQKMNMLEQSDKKLQLFSEVQLNSKQQIRQVQQGLFEQFQKQSLEIQCLQEEIVLMKQQKMAQA
jgi:integrase